MTVAIGRVRLAKAYLCMDCTCLTEPTDGRCECGSKALLNLARIVDREKVASDLLKIAYRGNADV